MSELLASSLKPNRNRRRVGEALAMSVAFGLVTACGSHTGAAESQPTGAGSISASAAALPTSVAKPAPHAPAAAHCSAENPDDWREPPATLRTTPIALQLGTSALAVANGTMVTANCKNGVSWSAVSGAGAVVTVDHIPSGWGLAESEVCLMFMVSMSEPAGKLAHHVAGVCPESGA